MRALGKAFRTIAEERVEMIDIVDEVDEILEQDMNEKRAAKSIIYQKCLDFSTSKGFMVFISLAILANTVVLGLDQYPNNTQRTLITDFLNFIFYVIFFMEMIVR